MRSREHIRACSEGQGLTRTCSNRSLDAGRGQKAVRVRGGREGTVARLVAARGAD